MLRPGGRRRRSRKSKIRNIPQYILAAKRMSSAVGHFFAADLQRCNQQKDKLRGPVAFCRNI
ncbi:MAG: hypothetical protein DBX53_02705 [Clostridiales bacterium]|nr:MAG: hypothetical protein DBX53_02705 [Clostridiales bacterium]